MKTLFLSFIALLSVTFISAQTTIKPGIGINLTDFSKDPATGEYKSQVGWQIGGTVAFGKKFYVEPGVFYVGKSTEFQSSTNSIPDLKASINGIRIPVAVGLNVLGNEKTMFSLRGFGGLSGFFVTSVGNDLRNDNVQKTNFGVFAGAGLDIWKLYLDLSYEWSMTNIQKDVSTIDFGKSRSLFITAGLRINL